MKMGDKPGSISRIYLKDFVTYSEITLIPGPNLNLILGPNGTGKSTIIAGIILGLGGNPKIIGRGSKVSEYVRHTCESAKITITLNGRSEQMVTISRKFNVNNHSTWYLNDKVVSPEEIIKTTKKFNIQVNNLCQFLPQDRVQDFAKMNNKELLLNTQKALGRDDLLEKYQKLIDMQDKKKNSYTDIKVLESKIEKLESNISRLENKVQNMNTRREYLKVLDDIKRKICWGRHEKLVAEKEEIEHDWKTAQELLLKQKKKNEPLQNKKNELVKKTTMLQKRLLQIKTDATTCKNEINTNLEQVENILSTEIEILCEKRLKMEEIQKRDEEIRETKNRIDKLMNDQKEFISNHGQCEDIKQVEKRLETMYKLCSDKCDKHYTLVTSTKNMSMKLENDVKNCELKLSDVENLKQRRLDLLRKRDQDAYKAVLWLRENEHLFQGAVYEPMILELDVKDTMYSKYFENIISIRDRVAFTCELREDMNILLRHVRDQQKLAINVLHSGSDHPSVSQYKPPIPIDQLKPYGLFAYASSLLSGPEAILKYLCRMYGIHSIPIGDHTTYNKAATIPPEIKLFFSENHRFAVSSSRYTHEKSTRISEIVSDGTFSVCADHSKMERIQEELQNLLTQRKTFQSKSDEMNRLNEELIEKRNSILVEIKKHKQVIQNMNAIKSRLDRAQHVLREIENSPISKEEIEQNAKDKMKAVLKKSLKSHHIILELQTKYMDYMEKDRLVDLEIKLIEDKITCLENEAENLKRTYDNSQRNFQKLDELYKLAVREESKTLDEAKKLSNGLTPKDKEFELYTKSFKTLPSDESELQLKLDEIQSKIECLLTADMTEIQAYENDQKELAVLRANLEDRQRNISEFWNDFRALQSEWFEPLNQLVSEINSKFGNYFLEMDCAGEVQISNQHPMDIESYGLTIRVTFHNNQALQELNQFVQSGGERAVTTAIYLLSMQDLIAVPFRCIDEINQGMDPHNERRIFKILVNSTSKPDSCQYFLVSPKLISGLLLGGSMRIHVIHSGPYIEYNSEFNNKTILENLAK